MPLAYTTGLGDRPTCDINYICFLFVWATKREGVWLIVRPLSFQDFQPVWSWSTNVTDRQTDGQTDGQHALCTI